MRLRLFGKKNPIGEGEESYSKLVKFLIAQISSPALAGSIIEEAKQFLKLKKSSQDKDLVRIYLLFQKYCCHVDQVQKVSEKAFNRKVIQKFPWLKDNEYCRIPFKSNSESKILLAALFLHQIISPIGEISGSKKGNVLEDYKLWVDSIWNENHFFDIDLPGLKKGENQKLTYPTLVKLSKIIFEDLSERFGLGNISSLYQRSFSKTKILFKNLGQLQRL